MSLFHFYIFFFLNVSLFVGENKRLDEEGSREDLGGTMGGENMTILFCIKYF